MLIINPAKIQTLPDCFSLHLRVKHYICHQNNPLNLITKKHNTELTSKRLALMWDEQFLVK